MALHRTQLFLDPNQFETLAALARSQRRSISEVVRELLDRAFEGLGRETRHRLVTLDRLAELGREIGPVQGDPISEVRAERERQREGLLAPEAPA